MWCATTYNYDGEFLWGNCGSKYVCCFHRNYGGISCQRVWYLYHVIRLFSYIPMLFFLICFWKEMRWSHFEKSPSVIPILISPSCSTATACEATTELTTPCQTFTYGGTGNNAPCNFPFLYRGNAVYECIANNHNGTLWCATTYNYDVDFLWGNCGCKYSFCYMSIEINRNLLLNSKLIFIVIVIVQDLRICPILHMSCGIKKNYCEG